MNKNETYPFCSVEELKRSKRICKFVDELKDEISAFYLNNQFFVISSICPHFGGEFDFSERDCMLTCKWHGWQFDLKTGKSIRGFEFYRNKSIFKKILMSGRDYSIGCFPFKGELHKYDFKINNDTLEVILP